jgi:hypothetical protein
VAESCPRADLGVIDGTDTCVEAPAPGQANPEKLRCGLGADDLAVGLSGQTPSQAWLTRHSLLIAAGSSGAVLGVTFPGGSVVTPVINAGTVDLSDCSGGSSSSSSSSGVTTSGSGPTSSSSGGSGTSTGASSGGGSNGTYYPDPYAGVGCDCNGTAEPVDDYETQPPDDEETSGYDYQNDDDCEGDSSDTSDDSSDGCSGDTSESGSDEETSGYDYQNDDDCGGDTTDTSSSGDGCSGDSGGDGSSSDGCSSDSSGSSSGSSCKGDSSGSSGDGCSMAKRRRSPKLSLMTFCAALVLAPLRRKLRKKPRRS